MKKLFLLLCVCVSALTAGAQELRVTALKAPQQVKFAEPFDMNISVVYPQGYTVEVSKEKSSPDFEIVRTKETPAADGGAIALSVRPYTLNASTFTVVLDLMHNEEPVLEKEVQLPLTVSPVQVFKDQELREIRAPRIPLSWVLLLLILLVAAAVAWLIYSLTRTKQQTPNRILSSPKDNRPCHVIALAQITALLDSGLWENKQYKVFYFALSDILREYIWRRFQVDTSADTSAELLKRAKKTDTLSSLLPQLRAFVSSGDLVKFAKFVPTEAERNADITLLQEIIKKTVPPPPPEKEVKP
jgi:hypothetical protein